MSQQQKSKKNLTRNLIWAGIIFTSLGLLITVIDAALSIPDKIGYHNPNNLWYPTGFWGNIWNSLSTFTIQSNILVLVFFILALINLITKNKLQTINHGWFKFAVTIYISITLIIFWAALFKPLIDTTDFSKSLDLLNFFNTFILHLFTPLIMIIYFFKTSGTNKWTTKATLTKALPIIISYMFIYLAYALIKGSFVGKLTEKNGYFHIDYSYPYFFLNVKENLGIFFLFFFIILLLFLALFALYYYYNNAKYDRDHRQRSTMPEVSTIKK